MSLLSSLRSLFRSGGGDAPVTQRECLHGTLFARWDEAADMGDESKATEFICSSCDEHFSPDMATDVRRRAVERLKL